MLLLKVGAVLAAIPLAMAGAVAATGVAVVDVKDSQGHRIVVPVPLMVVEAAARLAPARAAQEAARHIDQVRQYLPVAEEVLAALAESPDCELVSVDDGDEHVRVSKVGDTIRIRVEGRRERVLVNVPLSLVHDAVRQAHHGRLDPGDLVAALRRARMTNLVDVVDGNERVKISIW